MSANCDDAEKGRQFGMFGNDNRHHAHLNIHLVWHLKLWWAHWLALSMSPYPLLASQDDSAGR